MSTIIADAIMGACGLLPPPRLTDRCTPGDLDGPRPVGMEFRRARAVWPDGNHLVLTDDHGDLTTVPLPGASVRELVMADLARLTETIEQHTCRICVAVTRSGTAIMIGWECEDWEL